MTTSTATTRTENARTEGAQRFQERKHMMAPLAKIAARWASEEKELDRSELEIRYRWARDVKTVYASPDLYGRSAVEALFDVCMTRDQEPRVYKSVGNYIDADFFDTVRQFNSTKSARRGHIAWSHLIEFARVGDPEPRQELLVRCMAEQWSVATLRNKVDEYFDQGLAEPTTERRQAGVGAIAKRVARSVQKLVKDTTVVIGKEFLSSLDLVRPSDRDTTIALVVEAREAVSNCRVQLVTTEQALDAALTTLISQSDDPEAIDVDATESEPLDQTAEDEPLPVTSTVKRMTKKVRRRVKPVVAGKEMAAV